MLNKNLIFTTLLFCFCFQNTKAQLGFCNGNSGDPIFTETFGTGITNGPELPAESTTYTYINGVPPDGSYTIASSTANYYDWFSISDHTPGDTNGKALIVNASFTPGEFFSRTIDGLCENTSYEFSSWLINLLPVSGCGGNGIPINVRFQIWDSTDTNLLATGDTGDIFSKASPTWEQYALVFQTLPAQTSVILKMLNNGVGGCGNDLAIDDIVFKTCGDSITLNDSENNSSLGVCQEDLPVSVHLIANPDFSVYTSHAYQWQVSTDRENWTDITGANSQTYTTPLLNNNTYYRVKVAEDAINLTNSNCNTVSDIFDVVIESRPSPPTSEGNVELCVNKPGGVLVSVPDGTTVNWYDAPTGGNLLQENTNFYSTQTSGTYYAEAITLVAGCNSNSRTAVTITYSGLPEIEDETVRFCIGSSTILSAKIPNASYVWNTGETSEEITITSAGTYSVTITDENRCSATKTIVASQLELPIIQEVISNHRDFTVLTENQGDFQYSLDGFTYQNSPVFEKQLGGIYTIFVRSTNDCPAVSISFTHVVIPRFFTPNGDGVNENFRVEGASPFDTFEIRIFDRTSKLLAQSLNPNFSWDGTFNNRPLPASDYWYRIQVGKMLIKGHFALKR